MSGCIIFSFLMICLFCFTNSSAQIVLPKILGNGMVLQRNQPVPIWGTATAGEKVTVKFIKVDRYPLF